MRENALWRGNAHRPNVFGNALGNYVVGQIKPQASAPEPVQQQAQSDDPFDIGANFKRGLGEKIDQYYEGQYQQPLQNEIDADRGYRQPNASDYQKYVSVDHAKGLNVRSTDKLSVDAFEISPRQLAYAKDVLMLVGGYGTALTGLTIGFSGAFAPVGASLAVIGINEGGAAAASLYNRLSEGDENNFNLMERALVKKFGENGTVFYHGISFSANALSLGARIPLAGFTDGINDGRSIFGVTVTRWNSPQNFPLTQVRQPEVLVKSALLYETATKGHDLYGAMRDKK